MEFIINTSTNTSIGETPFKILYSIEPRDSTITTNAGPENATVEEFKQERNRIRELVLDALKLA